MHISNHLHLPPHPPASPELLVVTPVTPEHPPRRLPQHISMTKKIKNKYYTNTAAGWCASTQTKYVPMGLLSSHFPAPACRPTLFHLHCYKIKTSPTKKWPPPRLHLHISSFPHSSGPLPSPTAGAYCSTLCFCSCRQPDYHHSTPGRRNGRRGWRGSQKQREIDCVRAE